MNSSQLCPKNRFDIETDILQSIAFTKIEIANLINSEVEILKLACGTSSADIQKKLQAKSIDDLIKINLSINNTISSLASLESSLEMEMNLILNNCPKN